MKPQDNNDKFFQALEKFPRLLPFWDKEHQTMDIKMLEQELGTMSNGEQAIARFLAGVWLGNNQFKFDVISHISDFDENSMVVFNDWAKKPYFP